MEMAKPQLEEFFGIATYFRRLLPWLTNLLLISSLTHKIRIIEDGKQYKLSGSSARNI